MSTLKDIIQRALGGEELKVASVETAPVAVVVTASETEKLAESLEYLALNLHAIEAPEAIKAAHFHNFLMKVAEDAVVQQSAMQDALDPTVIPNDYGVDITGGEAAPIPVAMSNTVLPEFVPLVAPPGDMSPTAIPTDDAAPGFIPEADPGKVANYIFQKMAQEDAMAANGRTKTAGIGGGLGGQRALRTAIADRLMQQEASKVAATFAQTARAQLAAGMQHAGDVDYESMTEYGKQLPEHIWKAADDLPRGHPQQRKAMDLVKKWYSNNNGSRDPVKLWEPNDFLKSLDAQDAARGASKALPSAPQLPAPSADLPMVLSGSTPRRIPDSVLNLPPSGGGGGDWRIGGLPAVPGGGGGGTPSIPGGGGTPSIPGGGGIPTWAKVLGGTALAAGAAYGGKKLYDKYKSKQQAKQAGIGRVYEMLKVASDLDNPANIIAPREEEPGLLLSSPDGLGTPAGGPFLIPEIQSNESVMDAEGLDLTEQFNNELLQYIGENGYDPTTELLLDEAAAQKTASLVKILGVL